ncbi:serine phosphatase RsbU (regulator of sigma subunit) [Blastococcus colisei]|uniref:Serine phosphatase RsbU (Regulator of sigma subunit) n=1 Tax=Blastococcus colisei TaxID=1564162 RepID=A0A543PGP7_9ACTN|nr:GAF domain-containing SpoIIE family protein phosphatase [Blastococcus colisei]TQN43258.1 serine phosphatase RsbU (regulator of sigma subunit) [Blastococcus colisei]
MTGAATPGRCLVVDPSAAEAAVLLAGLTDLLIVPAPELEAQVRNRAGPVDLVVIGSLAPSPVAAVQHAHRLAPAAAVAVLSADPDPVRREASFAPGVPIDLLVAGTDEGDVPERLQQLRESSIDRRRHAAVLDAVVRRTAAGAAPLSGLTAVGALLEHAPIGVLVASPEGDLLGWNRRAEALLDLRSAAGGQRVDSVVPGAAALVAAAAPASDPGAPPARPAPPLQVRVAGRLDVELSAVGSQTDRGRPVVLLLAADVTAHREAERERDRLAGQVQLLGRVSVSLMESLDVTRSLSRLADAVVPALGDWVGIEVRHEHEQVSGVVVRHSDPALAIATRMMERLVGRNGAALEPARRASRGESVLLPRIDDDGLRLHVPDADLRAVVGQLGMAGVLAVPIPGRTGVLGSLLLSRSSGEDAFSAADLELAVEIGRRAGIAVDNARLYVGQRNLASELQQSLLTAPPTLPSTDISVRYLAAAQEAQVGGDWYDAFRRRSGDLMVVIGDVAGHDTRAAAAMGQLRGLVRSIGFVTEEEPSQVLTSVDEAIDGLELNTIATAVVAQISPQEGGDGTAGLRLRWSNAGHPPPVLVDPDGRVRLLEPSGGRAALLLGVDPTTRRVTEETLLPVGSTLLLYTDGLIERRSQILDEGLDLLMNTIRQHAARDPEQLCDAILGSMVPQAGEDDVAIVAVRPRPSGRHLVALR